MEPGEGLVQAALALLPAVSRSSASSRETVSEKAPESESESDGIKSFSDFAEALGELEVKSKETAAVLDSARRKRKNRKYADYVTGNGKAFAGDEIAEALVHAAPSPAQAPKKAKRRLRTIVLNNPPQAYTEKTERGYILTCGKYVLVRKPGSDLIGVDECAPGKFRSRFSSNYLGRFSTARAAADAHDAAACEHLAREAMEGDSPAEGPPEKKPATVKRRGPYKPRKPKGSVDPAPEDPSEPPPWLLSAMGEPGPSLLAGDASSLQVVHSCVCSCSLKERDVALSATQLNLRLPLHMTNAILSWDTHGQEITVEILDEREDKLVLTGHLMVVDSDSDLWSQIKTADQPQPQPTPQPPPAAEDGEGSRVGYLRLSGKWGQYARCRQLDEADTVNLSLSLCAKALTCKPHIAFATTALAHLQPRRHLAGLSLLGTMSVTKNECKAGGRQRITILEKNVESEVDPEILGFCYISGRLGSSVISSALGYVSTTRGLLGAMRSGQDDSKEIEYRMRVVKVCPNRGYGKVSRRKFSAVNTRKLLTVRAFILRVTLTRQILTKGIWILKDVPKGAVLFEYVGEVVSPETASVREINYLAKRGQNKPHGAPHYIYELTRREEGKTSPVVIVDATYVGNVSR